MRLYVLRNPLNLKQKFIATKKNNNNGNDSSSNSTNNMHEMEYIQHRKYSIKRDIFLLITLALRVRLRFLPSQFYRSRFMFYDTRVITFYNGVSRQKTRLYFPFLGCTIIMSSSNLNINTRDAIDSIITFARNHLLWAIYKRI